METKPSPLTGDQIESVKKPCRPCLAGWVGAVALLGFILIHIFTTQDNSTPVQPTTTNTNKTDEARTPFEAAAFLGAVDGMADYNSGRIHVSNEQLDANARRLTANMKFDTPTGRDDAIAGYTAGYDMGWNEAKK